MFISYSLIFQGWKTWLSKSFVYDTAIKLLQFVLGHCD